MSLSSLSLGATKQDSHLPAEPMTEIAQRYKDGEYLAANPGWHVADSAWKAEHVMRILAERQLQPRSIAEVGCGAGEILAQLHRALPMGTFFTGFDISADAIALASTRSAPRLQFRLEDPLGSDARYDLVLLMDVIEHVDDLYGFLRSVRLLAKHHIFHIPLDLTASSILRVRPLQHVRNQLGHVHYFTRETALASLSDCGFRIVQSRLTAGGIELTPPTFRSRAARIPKQVVRALSAGLAARLFGGFSLLVLTGESQG